MTKEEALKLFLSKEAKSVSADFVGNAMLHLRKEERAETVSQFVEQVTQMLKKAPSLSFFQIVLVRGQALSGGPFYRLEAYDEELYLSEPIRESWLEAEWLYQAYRHFLKKVEEEGHKYIKIGEAELNRIKLAELWTCQKIIRFLFFESLCSILQSEEYQDLVCYKLSFFMLIHMI